MTFNLADQYFLKALEGYDYDLESVVENLNYALSYDPEHSRAHELMGRMYMQQFHDLAAARVCFEEAIAADPSNVLACENLAWLLIGTKAFDASLKLIDYLQGLDGSHVDVCLRMKALVYEHRKEYESSIALLRQAIAESCNTSYIEFIERELSRIERKLRDAQVVRYSFPWE